MINEHQHLLRPSGDTKIWRYLNLAKYISLLETSSIYFTRADQFDDPFEGSLPDGALKAIETFFDGMNPSISGSHLDVAGDYLALSEKVRRFTFINCWHVNDFESDAMWRLYSYAQEGVAIQTTVNRLHNALDAASEQIMLGKVLYMDFDSVDPLIFFNGVTPFIMKRRAYEHENELRALIWLDTGSGDEIENGPNRSYRPRAVGQSVKVDLAQLVESVVVSPLAPSWFADLVRKITAKLSLITNVEHSRIGDAPVHRRPEFDISNEKTGLIDQSIVDTLHRQHLEYTEIQLKRMERIAGRQAEAISEWLREVTILIERAEDCIDGMTYKGKEAFVSFAAQLRVLPAAELCERPMFRLLYHLSGRIDNILAEIQKSVLPQEEKDLYVRRTVFLYTENIIESQVMLGARWRAGKLGELPEYAITLVGKMVEQSESLFELMNAKGI